VLGVRPRVTDPKGFVSALTQAFACERVAGHTECRWNPRSYAAEVRADLGAVTGAQGSLYSQARTVLAQCLPLLDGLTPLVAGVDPEDSAAVRAVVRSQLTELVNEIGTEGGPRVTRVEGLFAALLDDPAAPAGHVTGGSLGQLHEVLGIERARVNTVDEEQNLTNARLVVDWLRALRGSWDASAAVFGGSGEAYLGTSLLQLSRLLAVAGESVEELEAALDSVFLGAAERQVRRVAGSGLTVDELLSWVRTATQEEGPRLVQDGGRIGVRAFLPTLQTLVGLVAGATALQGTGDGSADPVGLPRVQRAVRELAGHLEAAASLAARVVEEPAGSSTAGS